MIYIHLYHPCDEIDVWYTNNEEENNMAERQGYISIDKLRELVEREGLAVRFFYDIKKESKNG